MPPTLRRMQERDAIAMLPAVAPAPAANQQDNVDTIFYMYIVIDFLMIGSAVIVAFLTVLSTYGRRSRNPILRFFLVAATELSIPLISYALSFDLSAFPLLTVSATFLLLIFKKIVSKKAQVREETDNFFGLSDDGLVERLTDIAWIAFLISQNLPAELHRPVWLLWCLILLKMAQSFLAIKLASRSYALGKNAKVIACYMADDQDTDFDISSCPYIFMGEEKLVVPSAKGYRINDAKKQDLVTVGKVWSCGGKLLRDKEKQVCLSFALFKLLRRRFQRLPLAESNTSTARNFVLSWPLKDVKTAFRIIEMELAFLNDYLFSPIPFCYSGWFPISSIILFLLLLSCCGWLGVGVIWIQMHASTPTLPKKLKILGILNASVLLTIMVVIVFMEFWEIETYVSSDWAKVVLLYKYIRNYPNNNPWLWKVLQHYCHRRGILKPWSNKLKQYSLSTDRKEWSIKVPDEVKKAIIESLIISLEDKQGILTKGEESLRRNEVTNEELLSACLISSNTKRILVWHIATSLCEYHKGGQAIVIDSSYHKVASSLSRYCAYLVASSPELLPDDIHWTQSIVRQVIKESRSILKVYCSDPVSKLNGIKQTVDTDHGGDPDKPLDVIVMGARLGRSLMGINEAQRWKVLADLWAEMMLYLTPSDAVEAHAQCLEKGGEFITLVWALLSHAGINDRP